jgi:hypothetical protein
MGNIGDDLIHAGTRQLLADIPYREVGTWDMDNAYGHTALVTGSGGWCIPFHHQLPGALPLIEARFERVIILPSTFDLSEPVVRHAYNGRRHASSRANAPRMSRFAIYVMLKSATTVPFSSILAPIGGAAAVTS